MVEANLYRTRSKTKLEQDIILDAVSPSSRQELHWGKDQTNRRTKYLTMTKQKKDAKQNTKHVKYTFNTY